MSTCARAAESKALDPSRTSQSRGPKPIRSAVYHTTQNLLLKTSFVLLTKLPLGRSSRGHSSFLFHLASVRQLKGWCLEPSEGSSRCLRLKASNSRCWSSWGPSIASLHLYVASLQGNQTYYTLAQNSQGTWWRERGSCYFDGIVSRLKDKMSYGDGLQ